MRKEQGLVDVLAIFREKPSDPIKWSMATVPKIVPASLSQGRGIPKGAPIYIPGIETGTTIEIGDLLGVQDGPLLPIGNS